MPTTPLPALLHALLAQPILAVHGVAHASQKTAQARLPVLLKAPEQPAHSKHANLVGQLRAALGSQISGTPHDSLISAIYVAWGMLPPATLSSPQSPESHPPLHRFWRSSPRQSLIFWRDPSSLLLILACRGILAFIKISLPTPNASRRSRSKHDR